MAPAARLLYTRRPAGRPGRAQDEAGETAQASQTAPGDRRSNGATEAELKKRTQINLYNNRPTWLRNALGRLDRRCSQPTAGSRS